MASGMESSVSCTADGDIVESHRSARWTTVVIPAYNEEESIAAVVLSAKKHSNKVIVVNDGSTDYTARLASAAGALVINIPKNSGKGIALSIGLTTAAIEDCDFVFVFNPYGVGEHTQRDLDYARKIGKHVVFYDPLMEESPWSFRSSEQKVSEQ